MPINPLLIKLALCGLALSFAAAFGAWKMHEHDQGKYDELVAADAKFKGGVASLAAAAEVAKTTKEAADRAAKEKSDAKNTADRAAARRTIDELRHQRDSARGAFLSSPPAGSKCPDGQVCFDAAQYGAAYGVLVGRLRGGADECTALGIDMDTAASWARERRGD